MNKRDWSRREFLKLGATAAAVGMAAPSMLAAGEKAPALEYRTLGRTGLKVTTVSLGCMQAPEEVIARALAVGVNLLDTAPDYKMGKNEWEVGRVLAGKRDQAYLCTKLRQETGDDAVEKMLRNLDESLKRLQTDHVDLLLLEGADTPDDAQNEKFRAALTRAKESKRARFIGVATHKNMAPVIHACVEAKIYDAVLTMYNFRMAEDVEMRQALVRARQEHVGIIAMKTIAGRYQSDDATLTPVQAAIQWALSNENVSCAVVGATRMAYFLEDIAVMGKRLGYFDRRRLERFAAATEGRYCAGCDECAGSCPQGVDIAAVRRCAMYLDGYGDGALARAQYRKLCAHAGACAECPSCTAQCRRGVALGPILREAHRRLA